MTEFRITEIGRYKLRNGDVVEVTDVADGSVRTKDASYFSHGMWKTHDSHPLDIVEKLPEEGEVKIIGRSPLGQLTDKMKAAQAALVAAQAPTMTASDGEEYPVEYWTTQQRFDEVTPPEGVDLTLWAASDNFAPSSFRYQLQHDDVWYWEGFEWERTGETWRDCRWTIATLAPSPAPEKQESQIWDEYLNDAGDFETGKSPKITLWGIKNMPDEYKALAAYIQHILSQDKGDA